MRNMKNILILVIFIILLAPLAAPIFLELKISIIKIEARERLERNHLVTLHILKENIHWTKSHKEIIIGHRLFDIKQSIQNGKEWIVKGIFDDEETSLLNKLNNLWQRQKSRQGNFLLKYLHQLGKTCFQENFLQIDVLRPGCKSFAAETNYCVKDVFIKIPSPPPQA
jgi:hypothetical protein